MEMKNLPLDLIVRNPEQPRKHFPEDELLDLADTIREVGVGQPIIVKPFGDKYMIIAGERRWRASGLAQKDSIPAIIRNDLLGGREALMRLIENVQRSELTTMETARYICYLREEENLTQEEVSVALGAKSNRSSVAHYLRLLNLPTQVQEMLDRGELGFGHGKALCGAAPEHQVEYAKLAAKGNWSVRRLEAFVSSARKAGGTKDGTNEVAEALARMESGASEVVGYPVKIQHSAKKNSGKVLIEYSSLDELDGIMERMGYVEDH